MADVTGALQQILRESPRPIGLPTHLETWRYTQTVQGDNSGAGQIIARLTFDLAGTGREWYACLTTVRMESQTPAGVLVSLVGSDFSEVGANTIATRPGGEEVDSLVSVQVIDPDNPVYLGRIVPKTDGVISFIWGSQVGTEFYTVDAKGYISEKPFVIPLTFSK